MVELFWASTTFVAGCMAESTRTGLGMPMPVIARVACTRFAFVLDQAGAVTAFSSAFALDRPISSLGRSIPNLRNGSRNTRSWHCLWENQRFSFSRGYFGYASPFFSGSGDGSIRFFSRYAEPFGSSVLLSSGCFRPFVPSSQVDAQFSARELFLLPMQGSTA